ncbi:hypothetical protein ACSMEV_20195 [Pseudomonas sp. MLB6B]|uniref:hypothetical protein n=1 Tax=unclassified Pseudomonas TaxID=196821 RepID=UPI0025FA1790|nr:MULTISPECIES: hypothetical protein [unclassified Pseudomonas]
MSIHVIKVHGSDVPEELRESGVTQAFCIEDETGQRLYSDNDLEVTRLAASLALQESLNEKRP